MPDLFSFDYAIVRVVPRVERGEFFNAGVIVFCSTQAFLRARVELDVARCTAMAPWLDCNMVEAHLRVIPQVCEGGKSTGCIGALPQRARFHWLVAPRSTIIQVGPVHTGLCHDLPQALDDLFEKMVRPLTI